MDIQLKKGLLDVCVLATLNEGDSYGYKIVSAVSTCIEVSESTLYPILKRLEAASFVTTYSVEHNGRLRKYYTITPKGREKINTFLEEWVHLKGVYDYVNERAGEGDE
jgi:PadR family transcriptional regulator PadR